MARTVKAIIARTLRELGNSNEGWWVSPGEFYQAAQERGYSGTQEDLLSRANKLQEAGYLQSARRGKNQSVYYRIAKSQFEDTINRCDRNPGTPSRLLRHPYFEARERFGGSYAFPKSIKDINLDVATRSDAPYKPITKKRMTVSLSEQTRRRFADYRDPRQESSDRLRELLRTQP